MIASTAAHAEIRYSWYLDRGPYFKTPAEVCIYARGLYDDAGAMTMALGADGFCREWGGVGYMYIVPHRVVVYGLSIEGAGGTAAMPAGPALPQVVRVTNDGAPVGSGIGVSIELGAQSVSGVTNGNSEVPFVFTPSGQPGSTKITASCSQCAEDATKTITVGPAQGDSCFGNPVDGASGAKIQVEADLDGTGAHPLAFVRRYNSQGAGLGGAASALGSRWSHNWDGAVSASASAASVTLGDGTQAQFVKSGNVWTAVGQSSEGMNRLASSVDGYAFTRASDDSVFTFDAAGALQSIRQRGGFTYVLSRDAAGRLAAVTNAFGDTLTLAYAASGQLAGVSSASGSVAYTYDTDRLVRATYADGRSRSYAYTDARWPQALTSIADEAGTVYATYAYDAFGRAISSDHLGTQQWQFSYPTVFGDGGGGSGTLSTSLPDPSVYRASTRVTGPLGDVQTYQWQGGDGRVTLLGASGAMNGNTIASRTMANTTLPASESDFLGYLTNYEWDYARRLPLSVTRAAGRDEAQTVRTQWHPVFGVPTSIEQGTRRTTLGYDEAGHLTSEAVTDTATGAVRTRSWSYDARGLLASEVDGAGGVWHHTHDERGNRIRSVNPLGQATTRTFDAASRLLTETSADGVVTAYTWDARNRVTSISTAGETTAYTYTPQGMVASVQSPSGYAVSYTYDQAHRLIGAQDNRGARIAYTLAADGTRVREEVSNQDGRIARLTGRTVNQLGQVQAVLGGAGQATQYAFDANGAPVAETDPLNQTTRRTLDGLQRTTAIGFADGASARQSWNALDALTAVVDLKGVQTGYSVNAWGETVQETSPDAGTVRYERDSAGNVVRQVDARGIVTAYERDALGRPLKATRSGSGQSEQVTTFTWDTGRMGYLARIDDASGSTAFERDALGRVTRKLQTLPDGSACETRYRFESGELAAVTYPSGATVQYNRDGAGRIVGLDVQLPGGTMKKPKAFAPFVTDLTHTALGQPQSWRWASGDAASRAFDADGRLTGNEFASYGYDAAGRIASIGQKLWAAGTDESGAAQYFTTQLDWTVSNDNRNRVTGFARQGASTQYTYDANSNRVASIVRIDSDTDLDGDLDAADFSATTSQSIAVDPASNRTLAMAQTLSKVRSGKTVSNTNASVSYSIDAAGNLTSDGLKTFEYGPDNRLSKVKLMKDGEAASASYLHNALGQRVFAGEVVAEQTLASSATLSDGFVAWLKTNFKWLFDKASTNPSIGTAFVHGDGPIPEWALLGDYDNGSGKGAGRSEYIWLPTQDGGVIPIGLLRGGRLYAIHTDHLGTPRLMTDDANQPVWQWPYSAFGDNKPTGILKATAKPRQAMTISPMLKATAPAQALDLRFPGQVADTVLGMNSNHLRMYSDKLGRYSQFDPIGLRGGLNGFVYVDGSPLKYTDPLGLMKVFDADNGVSFHAYPGPPAGGNEHARAGAGENYHMHMRDSQGREARMSTETWRPLTAEDERIFRSSKQMQQACQNLTEGQKKFLDRVNREVFHRGVPTDKQLMRLLQMRLGGRFGGGRGGE